MIRRAVLPALTCAASLIFSVPAMGQGQGRPSPPTVAPPTQMGPPVPGFGTPYSSLTVTVADESGMPLAEQALVKLSSPMLTLKGRAWIAADNYQIVHLEADLLNPLPKIQLRSQHQAVDYGPVLFRKNQIQLWLPKSAELYFDFRRRFYHRHETFDNYRLFSVGTLQKIDLPKIPDDSEKDQQPQHQ